MGAFWFYNKKGAKKKGSIEHSLEIRRDDSMHLQEISGQRQLTFMQNFDYIREACTEGEWKAAKEIQKYLKNIGLDCRLEAFEVCYWKVIEASFVITEPYEKEYTITGYGCCGNTPEGGVEAPFYYAENGDDINLSYASGKIVMVNTPMDTSMYKKLVEKGAVGFLTIAGSPIDQGVDLIPCSRNLRGVKEPSIQGGILHFRDAMELVEKGASNARLIVKQEQIVGESYNVITKIEGTDKKEEILTLTAHYDTDPDGKGAYDNMAGSAIIMELCEYFKKYRPRRSMEFVWFGAEEKGLCGSRDYVSVHEKELQHHMFNMNVDLAGQLVGGTVIGVTGDQSICKIMEDIARQVGIGMVTKHMIWGSDSNSFAAKGVPAMTLNRDGFGMHTPHDTLEWISPWSLQRSAQLLCAIAHHLAEVEEIPFSREIPKEFMEKLQNYLKMFQTKNKLYNERNTK